MFSVVRSILAFNVYFDSVVNFPRCKKDKHYLTIHLITALLEPDHNPYLILLFTLCVKTICLPFLMGCTFACFLLVLHLTKVYQQIKIKEICYEPFHSLFLHLIFFIFHFINVSENNISNYPFFLQTALWAGQCCTWQSFPQYCCFLHLKPINH